METETRMIKTKPHYAILDGLRGVAALMVVWYHIFEGFATSPLDQKFNHGYLAVDFFYILSGFVIGYAYNDRWGQMSFWGFIKRRLIRLHPMVVFAAIAGAISFLIQGSVQWDGTHISLSQVLIGLTLTILLIPSFPGGAGEVRGNGEMFPLNGPSWSLFFEYIANIMYALFLRRLSTKVLRTVVIASGIGYAAFAMLNGSGTYNMGVGWTMAGLNFIGGLTRVTFAFSCGLLISRDFKPIRVENAFWKCSAILILLLSAPYIGIEANWINSLYDTVCTTVIFPLLVLLGASESSKGVQSNKIFSLLGDISYPLYMIHYPIMYLFYAWLWKNGYPGDGGLNFSQAWPVAVAIFISMPVLAYICLRLYDIPVRKWLGRRLD